MASRISQMKPTLSRSAFMQQCRERGIPSLAMEIPFEDPASVYSRVMGTNTILLESAKGPEKTARYSFIAVDPYLTVRGKNGMTEVIRGEQRSISNRKPLHKVREILRSYPHVADPSLPPFQGGAVGLISYDYVHYFERLPRTVMDDLLIPDAHFLIVNKVIAFDHLLKKAWIVVSPGAEATRLGYNVPDPDFGAFYDRAEHDMTELLRRITTGEAGPDDAPSGYGRRPEIRHDMEREHYLDMVRRAKEYITAGDIFQANLSQRLSADIEGISTWGMYQKLSQINPSPFASYLDFGEYTIVSSSPERLVKLAGGTAQTRPIAGTRPRGRNIEEDESFRRELILNEKERAEHIMLIDLERNDLGKVCDYGSVEVDELMITEDYSHVIHIVSNVRGRMVHGKDAFDLIRAVFPGGTITGVPKVRCMEIIDELEPVARGPYTGSVGYIGYDGTMDLNIVIRTFVCRNRTAYVHVGAGIVADSVPEREYEETLKKGEALIRTLLEIN